MEPPGPSPPPQRGFDATDAKMVFLVTVWGTAFAGISELSTVLDPYQMTWFRYAPFPVIYGIWIALRRRDRLRQVTGKEWVVMGCIGAVGVLGYHFPLNWAMDASAPDPVSAATGAILIATTPLWTLLLATLVRQERWSAGAALGSLVAFSGVAIVVLLGRGEVELTLAAKALAVLGAALSWAAYSIVTRPLVLRHGGLFVTGTTLGIGTLTLLPIGLRYGTEPLQGLSAGHWGWLLFLALLSTALGYAIWNQALKVRAASQVAVYVYFNPVAATLAAWFFLGQSVTPWFVAGAALVLGGVVLVNRSRQAAARAAGGAGAAGATPETAPAPAPAGGGLGKS